MNSASIRLWLAQHRSSARTGFLLQVLTRGLSSILNLIWIRLLLDAMGVAVNGLYLTFQSAVGFATFGDLGIGGAVAFKTGLLIGQKDETQLRDFLSIARGLFVVLSVASGCAFIALSPWLAGWLGFASAPAAGSMTVLFVCGGVNVGMLVFSSYLNNLNYGCANVVWPVIPSFLLLQFSLAGHWLLARGGAPLWAQYLPYTVSAAIGLALSWMYLRASYPILARFRPLRFNWGATFSLLEKSVWLYLFAIHDYLNLAVAKLFVNAGPATAGFGPETVPVYEQNFKLCALALLLISSAVYVGLPKIAHLIVSPDTADRAQAAQALRRLSALEIALGAGAALVYLAVNSTFVAWWLPLLPPAPLSWQSGFAATVVVMSAGDTGLRAVSRCGEQGLRFGGAIAAACGLLYVVLAYCCAKTGWLAGLAWAVVVTQSVSSVANGLYLGKKIGISGMLWVMRTWVLPLCTVLCAIAARERWAPDSIANTATLAVIYIGLFLCVCHFGGFTWREFREEAEKVGCLIGMRPR